MSPSILSILRVVLPLAGATLASSASAQVPESPDYPQCTSAVRIKSEWPGALGRSVAGDFSSDGLPDIAIMKGSDVVLLYNPGSVRCAMRAPLTSDANAICALPGDLVADWPRLAVVGASGVTLVRYDARAAVGQRWLINEVGGTGWAGATIVCAGDVDGNGTQDLIGVMANHRTVRVLLRTSAGHFDDGATFELPSDAQDVISVQLDADDPCELAFQCDIGLVLTEANGTQIGPVPVVPAPAAANMGMCCLPHEGSLDKVAFMTTDTTPGTSTLHVVAGDTSCVSTSMNTLRASGLTTARWNNLDTCWNLLVTRPNGYNPRVLPNSQSPDAPFSLATGTAIQTAAAGPAPTANVARCAWTDFDLDGKPDVAVPLDPESGPVVKLFSSNIGARSVSGENGGESGGSGDEGIDHPVFKGFRVIDGTSQQPASPMQLQVFFMNVDGHTRVEADLYVQPLLGGMVNPTVERHFDGLTTSFLLDTNTPPAFAGSDLEIKIDLDNEMTDLPFEHERIYYIVLRTYTPAGPTTAFATSAVAVAAFCGQALDSAAWNYVYGMRGGWRRVDSWPDRLNDDVGGLLPMPAVPLVNPDGEIGG